MSDSDWTLLQRYDDPLDAEVALHFLREHGVEAEVVGAGASALMLGAHTGLADARLYVHPWDVDRARDVLSALAPCTADHATDAPGDDAFAPRPGSALAPYRAAPDVLPVLPFRARRRFVAFTLGLVVPFGAGHFYARHGVAGVVFGAAIVTSFAAGVLVPVPFLAIGALMLVALDAVLSIPAVVRYNDGRVTPPGRQAGFAALAVALTMAAAYVLVGRGRPEPRNCTVAATP